MFCPSGVDVHHVLHISHREQRPDRSNTFWPLGRVMVSGPVAVFFGAVLLLPLLPLLLRPAAGNADPFMPFVDGVEDLLFLPIVLVLMKACQMLLYSDVPILVCEAARADE